MIYFFKLCKSIKRRILTCAQITEAIGEHFDLFKYGADGIFHDLRKAFGSLDTAGDFIIHRIHGILGHVCQDLALIV